MRVDARRSWAFFVTTICIAPVGHAADERLPVVFRQESGKLLILIGQQPVADYVYSDPDVPRPYFANVRSLTGVQLTRNFPPIEGQDASDHATLHPGIALAFGDLNGTDFWRNHGRVIQQSFVEEPTGGMASGSFAVRNRYETSAGEVVCEELCRRQILVREAGYFILWESIFSAKRPFYFGDQEEMGLGLRLATPIVVNNHQGGRILNSQGSVNEQAVWGKAATWCDYSGPIDGVFAGITCMPHPDNFRPCWWHARDYGFLGANPFGRHAFGAGPPSKMVVATNESFRLRFGIWVHSNALGEEPNLQAAYADYLAVASQN